MKREGVELWVSCYFAWTEFFCQEKETRTRAISDNLYPCQFSLWDESIDKLFGSSLEMKALCYSNLLKREPTRITQNSGCSGWVDETQRIPLRFVIFFRQVYILGRKPATQRERFFYAVCLWIMSKCPAVLPLISFIIKLTQTFCRIPVD